MGRSKEYTRSVKARTRLSRSCQPIKRRPYVDYRQKIGLLEQVYSKWFQGPGRPNLTQLSEKTGIPKTSLHRWYTKFRADPKYRNFDYRAKGEHHRIFTRDEEDGISQFIRENILSQHLLFTDDDFRTYVMSAFLTKYRDDDIVPEFNVSAGFISDFKAANGFSSRRSHFKRRPNTTPERIAQWKDEMAGVMASCHRDRILNCDETSWRLFPSGLMTWADTGAECVQIDISGDEKENLTALATVSAAGCKLPLFILARGKTELVERSQLGDIAHHRSAHTESGWMTEALFECYLLWLAGHMGEGPIHLVLDIYSAHRTEAIRKLAEGLGITLHYIPAGLTDAFQPLDRCIFGPLKATARLVYRRSYCDTPWDLRRKVGKPQAVESLIYAWEHLNQAVIEKAWSIY